LKGKKMILKKTKALCLPVLCAMAFALVMFQMPAQCHALDIDIAIDVSPNVINIQSQSTVVTVHTDIAFSLVAGASVYLNGVAIDWWKSDDRGNFVAKFDSDEIKALEGLTFGAYNTLTLIGVTTGGEDFTGSQNIMVINNLPAGKK
jgi:hypothetical protein